MNKAALVAERAVWTVAVAATVIFLWPVVAPGSAPVIDSGALLVAAALTKGLLLFSGAVFATLAVTGLGRGNPARRGWALVAVALWAYALGQLGLIEYQVIRGIGTPFPSPADVFFVTGSVLLITALGELLRAYLASGFLPIRRLELVLTFGASLGLATITARLLLGPGAPRLELTAAAIVGWLYPLTDILLLIPTILLLGLTWQLRGGRVWVVWASLAAGFLGFVSADIGFVFLEAGHEGLAPWVHWLYVVSYAAVARATIVHYGLIRGEAALNGRPPRRAGGRTP